MANWNLTDEAGMLALDVEAGDTGGLSGAVTYGGVQYAVSGGWAAASSTPARKASAFSFAGWTTDDPPRFISASGVMIGAGNAPQQVLVQGQVSASADGSITPFDVIARPASGQQPRFRGVTRIYFVNWANDLTFRTRLVQSGGGLSPITLTNRTAPYLPSREVEVANIQRGGVPSDTTFTAEILSSIAGIPITIKVDVTGTFADSTMKVSVRFGGQPWTELPPGQFMAQLIKAKTSPGDLKLGYKILARRREAILGHDDVVISLWPDSQDENHNESLPDWTMLQLIPLLDIGGEGRIADGTNVTGFPMAYNLNTTNQSISNGPNRGKCIPNKIALDAWDKPFPVDDGRVLFMTMMGVGSLNNVEVAQMMRCLDPIHGQVLLYGLGPTDIDVFDHNKAPGLVLKRTVGISDLDPPFSEIVGPFAPVRVYGWQGRTDKGEL